MAKTVLFILTIFFISSGSYSQEKYLVYFKDKGINDSGNLAKTSALYQEALNKLSKRAIERRKKNMGDEIITYQDLPVNETYLNELKKLVLKIDNKLTWFNAVSAYINDDQLLAVRSLPFVERVEPVKKLIYKKEKNENSFRKITTLTEDPEYGNSFTQLDLCDIPVVHSKGINGKGVIIGLLDTGFDWMNHESLVNTDVLSEWDFVFDDSITANEPVDRTDQHNHGTSVLSVVGGFKDGTLVGASFGSSFILAKTEYVPTETHVEEDNYAAALIWMENLGVDIASSSLGYSEFDAGQSSYTYNDMDGKTTIVTQACEMAFERGVVTITSAGNEGDNPWHYITAPADGFNTIAVGAVTSSNLVAGFSGRGPAFDGRIKPDVVTQGVNVFAAHPSGFSVYSGNFGGTSAAAPIACGVAGLLLSAHPHLTNVQMRDILLSTSDNSAAPNNERGYGLLSARAAINYPNFEILNDSLILHKIFLNNSSIDPSTITLHYSLRGSEFTGTVMNYDGIIRYSFPFPGQTENQYIEFYFTYMDSTGNQYREPTEFNYGYSSQDPRVIIIPSAFDLSNNYPNPFNNQTKIRFSSPPGKNTVLEIFNILGERIKVLYKGTTDTQLNFISWDGKDERGFSAPSGVYIYTLKVEENILSKKMMLLK